MLLGSIFIDLGCIFHENLHILASFLFTFRYISDNKFATILATKAACHDIGHATCGQLLTTPPGAPFSPLARYAAQSPHLRRQLPRTPLGAASSQYFGALCLLKARILADRQTAAHNAAKRTLLAILLARCCSKPNLRRTAAHNAAPSSQDFGGEL